MTVGEKIKHARKAKHLTQKELGEKCGINEANIRKYESGRQSPKLDTLQRIAAGLKIPVEDLIPSDEEFMQRFSDASFTLDQIQREHDKNSRVLDNPETATKENFRKFNVSFREDLLAQNALFDETYRQLSLTQPGTIDSDIYTGKTQIIIGLCGMMNIEGLNKVINYLTDLTQIPEYLL